MTLHVGVDVGGTFTDAVGVLDGHLHRAKAFSKSDVTTGILDALGVLRERLGLSEPEFVPAVDRFVVGSTIVTNAVDEQRYAPVGLITTHGFRDTLRIARSHRGSERDTHRLAAPPDIVDRRRIVEVTERVDVAGAVVIPLTDDAIAAAVRAVLDAGAETVAVCLLWSFRNPEHEQRIGEYLRVHHPEVPFSLSSTLSPVYREYERTVTTTLDAAVKPAVATHFEALSDELTRRGLRARIQVMQVHGGFLSVQETSRAPIAMFNSGPVGGVTGARLLGEQLGRRKLLTADMGGTSLDAAAIVDGELRVLPRAEIGGLPTSLTAVDIHTIGAGGGSIGWVDGRGVIRVGPHSAGSTPGPACYGNGGDRPTVTDAALLLGLLNPDYYLGGTVSLDVEKAREAIRAHIGPDVTAAVRGIYRIAATQIANALRRITVNRGQDPREFALVGFGGACGLFAAPVAADLGIGEVIVPDTASVFSANGLLHADSVFSALQTTPWTPAEPAERLEERFAALEKRAHDWFEAEGIPEADRELNREADVKFAGQIFEVMTHLPAEPFTEDGKDGLRRRFVEDYEAEFGSGTAWTEADLLVVNSRVRAVGRTRVQELVAPTDVETTETSTREALDPITGETRTVTVHRGIRGIGKADGPCLLEDVDTTVYVPDGWSAELREGHLVLRNGGGA